MHPLSNLALTLQDRWPKGATIIRCSTPTEGFRFASTLDKYAAHEQGHHFRHNATKTLHATLASLDPRLAQFDDHEGFQTSGMSLLRDPRGGQWTAVITVRVPDLR